MMKRRDYYRVMGKLSQMDEMLDASTTAEDTVWIHKEIRELIDMLEIQQFKTTSGKHIPLGKGKGKVCQG